MKNFDKAFDLLMINEGGYSDNPNDPGGETNWGVTKRVAVKNNFTGEMRYLPKSKAKEIYKERYWMDILDNLDFTVAFNIFDAYVNHGRKRAIKFAQKALCIKDDGIYGPETAIHLAKLCDNEEFICIFNAERLQFYTDLKTWRTFGKGWARRIVHNMKI